MKFKINFLLAAILALVFVNPSHATDVFTWKPGPFKLYAGGLQSGQGGSGKLATIIPISSLGQNTKYTIPDPGTATANFVLSPVTSSNISPDVLQHATVALSSANLTGMYAAPVLLISAPAAGKNIIVDMFMFTMIPSGTAYTAGGVAAPQINSTVHGAGTLVTATIAASVVNASGTTTTYNMQPSVAYAGTAATGLYISNQTAAFATGTGTAIADIWYHIQ